MLNVPPDELAFLPNATADINTVLRSMVWEEGDVVLYSETLYSAVEKQVLYLEETTRVRGFNLELQWPVSDDEVVSAFETAVRRINFEEGGRRRVRMAIVDTVISLPGLRMPFER